MPGTFDLWTVLFSFAIASLAGFVAFESIEHTRHSKRPERWTLISGIMLGLGIWSMHFIGMLAWQPPFPLFYALGRTAVSILAAIAASCVAMRIRTAARPMLRKPNSPWVPCSLALASAGCITSACRLSSSVRLSNGTALASDLVCYRGSGFVLCLGTAPSELKGRVRNQKAIAASLILGSAICGMHYSGMQP